jgi:hypothetical protein
LPDLSATALPDLTMTMMSNADLSLPGGGPDLSAVGVTTNLAGTPNLTFVTYSGGVGSYWAGTETGLLIESANGTTWTQRTNSGLPNAAVRFFVFESGSPTCIAGTMSGLFAKPTGSSPWTAINGAPTLNNAIFSGNSFIGVGPNGLHVSNDGMSWTQPSTAPTTNLTNIARGSSGTPIFAVGPGGSVFSSTNGTIWTDRTSALNASGVDLAGAAVATNNVIVVGNGASVGHVFRTTDGGMTWSSDLQLPSPINAVTHTGNAFVVVGPGGFIASSADGASWNRGQALSMNLSGVNAGGSKLVAVGAGATIVTGNK